MNYPPGKSLSKYVIDLLKLAAEKGFEWHPDIKDLIWQHGWKRDEKMFCAVACAGIQCWLRERYKLEAWVEPVVPGRYKGFIQYIGLRNKTDSFDSSIDSNYELQLIGTIDYALNALPTPDDTEHKQ